MGSVHRFSPEWTVFCFTLQPNTELPRSIFRSGIHVLLGLLRNRHPGVSYQDLPKGDIWIGTQVLSVLAMQLLHSLRRLHFNTVTEAHLSLDPSRYILFPKLLDLVSIKKQNIQTKKELLIIYFWHPLFDELHQVSTHHGSST